MAEKKDYSLAAAFQQIAKLNRRFDVLDKRFDKLANSFCLYHFDERKPPAFGIILQEYTVRMGPNKNRAAATLFIVTEHLGTASIVTDRLKIESAEESREKKWEPLVLPAELMAELDLLTEEATDEQPNGALAG